MIYYNFLEKYNIKNKLILRNWIKQTIQEEEYKLNTINIIICSDEYLLEINKKFLNHDYFTDIITFDYTKNKLIAGDLFISIDRVKENAKFNKILTEIEFHRVLIHGILHLCGFKDKSKEEKKLMTQKENFYLNKLTF